MPHADRRTLLRTLFRGGAGGLAAALTGFGPGSWNGLPTGPRTAAAATRFSPEANINFFTIATGPPGGTNFPIGVALATAVSSPPGTPPCDEGGACGVPNLVATAMTTAGSVVNVKGVVAGSFDSGMAQADVIFRAYHGLGFDFEGAPLTDLRVVANLFPQFVHVVVRANSTARSIADLKGRRIAVEGLGSGTRRDAELILAAYGIRPAPDQLAAIAQGDLATLLTEERTDAVIVIASPTL